MFLKIAAEMSKKGFNGVTGRMCEVKFKNLKTRFKIIKTKNGQTGNGRGPTWPYYDKMDDLFRNDVAVNPNNIVEAGAAGFNRIRRRAVSLHKYLPFSYVELNKNILS
jgi:hypothetical protein